MSVITDQSGNADFIFSIPPTAANSYLTATATDATFGNTSEFFAPLGSPESN